MVKTLQTDRTKLIIEFHSGVDRDKLLDLIERMGYSRQAVPIEPVEGEFEPQHLDNRSYVFGIERLDS